MALNYYQTANPGWGTQQHRFGPPRPIQMQPQSAWGGLDYYQNYAGQVADPNLWQHAWNRVRDNPHSPGADVGAGSVGLYEARHWHKKVYGGREAYGLGARELGHAAAYEAYRSYLHNPELYEPFNGDYARQREGMIGLAVGEVTQLMNARSFDHYSRMIGSETAAATASNLFWELKDREDDDEDLYRRGRSRSRVRGGGSVYGSTMGSSYDPMEDDDPYAVDELRRRRRARSVSRHGRSMSRHRGYGGMSPSASMPVAQPTGVATSAYGQQVGSVYGQPAYGQPASYAASGYGTPASYSVPAYTSPTVAGTQYVPSVQYGQQVQQVPMVYSTTGSTRSARSRSRPRASSITVPGVQYTSGYPTSGAQVVYVQPKKHKSRKHSKHRSHSQSRSSFFG